MSVRRAVDEALRRGKSRRQRLFGLIPYPPVFHDWRPDVDSRVSTGLGRGGVVVEMAQAPHLSVWRQAELTERDTALLVASLLVRLDGMDGMIDGPWKKLAETVLEEIERQELK